MNDRCFLCATNKCVILTAKVTADDIDEVTVKPDGTWEPILTDAAQKKKDSGTENSSSSQQLGKSSTISSGLQGAGN